METGSFSNPFDESHKVVEFIHCHIYNTLSFTNIIVYSAGLWIGIREMLCNYIFLVCHKDLGMFSKSLKKPTRFLKLALGSFKEEDFSGVWHFDSTFHLSDISEWNSQEII